MGLKRPYLPFKGVGDIHENMRDKVTRCRHFIKKDVLHVSGSGKNGLSYPAVVLVGIIRKIDKDKVGFNDFNMVLDRLNDLSAPV